MGHRPARLALALAPLALFALGCDAPAVQPESSASLGVVTQSSAIVGRDGGASALLWGKSVWSFGDTVIAAPDADGQTWHHNSFAVTDDLTGADGIAGLDDPRDAAGAPRYLTPPTEDERAFNLRHAGDPCEEAPCGARFATWPGAPVWDADADRGLIPYEIIYAEPGDFNFEGRGCSWAIWESLDADAERPVIDEGAEQPTALFPVGGPCPTLAPRIEGPHLFAFSCGSDGFERPCVLARVETAHLLERDAWRFWDGADWAADARDAIPVFDGGPIMSLVFAEAFGVYVLVYSASFSNDVLFRTAESLEGPWSAPDTLFVAERDEGTTYDAYVHPELSEDGGRALYVSYTRSNHVGWFGSELVLERVALEAR